MSKTKRKFSFGYFPFADAPVGIYRISKIDTNLCYIGMSKQISRRWHQHMASLKKNNHHCPALQKIYNKYGLESLRFEVVTTCLEKDLGENEQRIWDEHTERGWKLLNSRPDGKGGYTKTNDSIQKQKINTAWFYEQNRGKKRPEHAQFLKGVGKNFLYWRDDLQMYWCDKCKYGSNDSGTFDYHVNSNKHNEIPNDWKRGTGVNNDWYIDEKDIFYCGYCDYETRSSGDFSKHLNKRKHKLSVSGTPC